MISILFLISCLSLLEPSVKGADLIPIGTKGHYIYKNALHASLLFYEAQRSGKLPKDNRIKWRADSMLDDGHDVGHDLSGGYFDAGDLVKFGFPMAYTMTVLGWGLVDYEHVYQTAGELDNIRKAIRWGTDYFIKCHTSETEFYGQVGNGNEDHQVWGRPEDWPKSKVRTSHKVTSKHGGSDLTGETAAALAAASIAFKKVDPKYSEELLKHAKSLYSFADKYRDTYNTEIPDSANFYKSFSGYGDELGWAAAWLLRATNDSHYQTELDKHFKEFHPLSENPAGAGFNWDQKTAGVHTLMAEITGSDKYKSLPKDFCDYMLKAKKTPKGLLYMGEWGTLRTAAGSAFICLKAAKLGINKEEYLKFGHSQLDYMLGDTGRSFVVGVGVNPPTHPHHRAASCPDRPAVCDYSTAFKNPAPNPQILYGALVGGPSQDDSYTDNREDYTHNEVADDYNAAFTSAVAALMDLLKQ